MKFSTKIRYGIRAMLSIAMNQEDGGVFQKDIAKDQDISNKYLNHIISALKVSRLIRNAAGRKSGYILTRPPGEITMYDIHNAFEPGLSVIECLNLESNCMRSSKCASQSFWCQLNNQVIEQFKSVTLADLVDTQKAFNTLPQINEEKSL